MDTIRINHVLPYFISGTEASPSEIWRREASFSRGEYHLVAAHSGAGKSSLLSYLFGERTDYGGEILYDNRKADTLKQPEWSNVRQNSISFVFQGLRLFSELTAFENIRLKNQLTGHKTDSEIMCLLEMAGLADKCGEKAARLSFGQQQRVAIIRALCQPFDFLLMDEPFSHLDEKNIGVMAGIVTQELERRSAGLILCSLGAEYPFKYHRKWKL